MPGDLGLAGNFWRNQLRAQIYLRFWRRLLLVPSVKSIGRFWIQQTKVWISSLANSFSMVSKLRASSVSVNTAWIFEWHAWWRMAFDPWVPPRNFGTRWWRLSRSSGISRWQSGQIFTGLITHLGILRDQLGIDYFDAGIENIVAFESS